MTGVLGRPPARPGCREGTQAERLKALRNLLIEMIMHGWDEDDSTYEDEEA